MKFGAGLAGALLALAIAGCVSLRGGAESPGAVWSRLHASLDSLGASGRTQSAQLAIAVLAAQHARPAWLADDLARSATAWHRRAALPDSARAALMAADLGALRAEAMLERDSLVAAHDLVRAVLLARAGSPGATEMAVASANLLGARVALRMSRGDEAESLARAAIECLPAGARAQHPLTAEAEWMLGRIIKNLLGGTRGDEAMQHYRRALAISVACFGRSSAEAAGVHHEIGNLDRMERHFGSARIHFERALAIRRERAGGDQREVASTLTAIAHLSATEGRWRDVERRAREALAVVPYTHLTSPSTRSLRRMLLGQALWRRGRPAEGAAVLERAAADAESTWSRVAQDGAGSVQSGLSVYRELALALAAAGRDADAFDRLERGHPRVWAAPGVADPWSGLLARVQRVLPKDAALVAWPRSFLFPSGGDYPMWACVIRSEGPPHWARIERDPDWPRHGITVREALGREIYLASQWPLRVEDARTVDSLARRLGREVVTPIEPYLQGVTHLIVFGPELTASVTPNLLRDGSGRRLDERFAISCVPSALAFAALVERARAAGVAPAGRALLIGAPELPRGESDRWAPLAGATEELEDLARLFPAATLVTGRDASAARLAALAASGELATAGVVHFATHVDVDPVREMRTAFVLAPDTPGASASSRVPAARIANEWHVNAELVSLAGCRSAIGLYSPSEGWLGLQNAFLRAGARNVLVSLWRVDDAATSRLMVEFHRRLLERGRPRDAADALREAQRAVREYRTPDGRTPYAHPVYWAGFALVGAG